MHTTIFILIVMEYSFLWLLEGKIMGEWHRNTHIGTVLVEQETFT
jgi:hypothetical protein